MTLLIAILASFALAAILLLQWRRTELRQRAEQARAEAIGKLTGRFADSDEFLAFARSTEGRLLLGVRDSATEAARTLLLMLQGSVLIAALGVGFLATARSTPADADINLLRQAEEGQYWGIMCIALAVGLAVAFLLSQGRARKWGLLPK